MTLEFSQTTCTRSWRRPRQANNAIGLPHYEEQGNCANAENTSTIWLVASLHKADAVFGELLHGPHHWIYGLHNFLNKSTPNSRKHRTDQYNAMRARCMNAGSGELATNGVDAATRTSRWVNEVKRKGVVVIRYAWRILIRYKPMPHQSCQDTWISQEIRDISSLRAHEPRAVTMKLWEPKRKCPKAVPTHLQNRAVW